MAVAVPLASREVVVVVVVVVALGLAVNDEVTVVFRTVLVDVVTPVAALGRADASVDDEVAVLVAVLLWTKSHKINKTNTY